LSLIEFLAPVLLGLAIVGIRRMERFRSFMRRLTPIQSRWSSWDVAFSSQQQYFFVRAKLRSGKRVGGVFGQRSFASAYPEPQDLFLEQAWELAEDGSLLGRVPGSRGLFLRREDVEVLEFMAMEVGDAQEQSR